MRAVTAPDPGPEASARPRWHWSVPSSWPREWPLTVLLAGFPLWWLLGLGELLVIAMAVPMALQLLRRRQVRLPDGAAVWAFFLLTVAASVFLLGVDAPGGVPGGAGLRVPVAAYRLLWYLACTVVLLWVANLDERELPTRRVVGLLGWMFVVTVVGGAVAVVAPTLQITSPMELLLPRSLAGNGFVKPIIHPAVATLASITGEARPRPQAPFAYANAWGANFSMFLPFFLVGWFARDAGWRRMVGPVVLVVAAVPVVFSLNRGLWASLAVGLVFAVVRTALTGRLLAVVGAVLCVLVAVTVFLASPLAQLSSERLANPHSNERRGELLTLTVRSTLEGSPVLGYGGTRDVQGSFASIAGGATPECPACRVPPLGTQGQLWLVVFSQGLLGTAAFLGFFGVQYVRHWRCRTTIEAVGVCVLLFATIQLLVYDTLGMPLYTLMIAIGLMWRERERLTPRVRPPTLGSMVSFLARHAVPVVGLAVVGAVLGGVVAFVQPVTWTARAYVLLEPAPVHLDLTGSSGDAQDAPETTLDTEASMVLAEETLDQAQRRVGQPVGGLRERVTVTAVPTTRVLVLGVRDDDPQRAVATARSLVDSYLLTRSAYLAQRRSQVLAELQAELVQVSGRGLTVDGEDDPDATDGAPVLVEDAIRAAIEEVTIMPTAAGEVLRAEPATRDRRPVEVPVTSGALLGLLAGLLVGRSRDQRELAQPARRPPGRPTGGDGGGGGGRGRGGGPARGPGPRGSARSGPTRAGSRRPVGAGTDGVPVWSGTASGRTR